MLVTGNFQLALLPETHYISLSLGIFAPSARSSVMSAPVRERVRNHRKGLKASGLKRVELIVPAGKEDELRRMAARLRGEAALIQLSTLQDMLREAFRNYRASCLDNISIDVQRAGPAEARIVADALMKGGNSEAFLLGRRIARLARRM